MNRSVSVGIVVLVFVVLVAGIGAPMASAGANADERSTAQPQPTPVETQAISSQAFDAPSSLNDDSQDFDKTTFEITVHENGSATWTFQHQQRFDSENETEEREAFEEFAAEFEAEETGLYERFTDQADALVDSGADQTGREMEATNFQRSATVEDQFGTRGIVEMSFTWEAFAVVNGNSVEVGDVFQNIYIGSDQSIVIVAGDGLVFDRVEPDDDVQHPRQSLEDANSVQWSGEKQFLDGNPRAVLVQDGAGDGNRGGTGSTVAVPDADDAAWYLAVGAIAALIVGGGALWYRDRQTGVDSDNAGGTGVESAPQTERSNPGPETSNSPVATATPARDDEAESAAEPVPDEELLTDEDRVVRLIRKNGGRMKQVNIVDETGWSKSKVSMLLSDMEEEGTISKLRVGRENIISLEGFEPEATKSPFDE